MTHINTVKINDANTNTYYWDAIKGRFGSIESGLNHGFSATHRIIVDAELTAQELDIIFAEIL